LLISLVEKLAQRSISIEIMPESPADLKFTLADNTLINSIFQEDAWVGIESGILQTIKWFKEY
jgi:hypothetical protein